MTGLETTLANDFTTHVNTASGLVAISEATFDSNVDSINDALELIVVGLTATFDDLVDGHRTTLDGAGVRSLSDDTELRRPSHHHCRPKHRTISGGRCNSARHL
jgi:hypothetical protein